MSHRKKASDIFNEREPFFGKKVPFDKAFPMIQNIKVEVEEGRPGSKPINKCSLDLHSVSEYVNCANPECFGGGFSLGEIIREMIRDKKTEYEGTKHCLGYEGSRSGKIRYRNCWYHFKVKIHIDYKKT